MHPCESLDRFALPKDLAEKLNWIGSECLGDRDELGYIDLALLTLNHPDHGMRSLDPGRQVSLRELGFFAGGRDHHGDGPGR